MADEVKILIAERNGVELAFREELDFKPENMPFSDPDFSAADVKAAIKELFTSGTQAGPNGGGPMSFTAPQGTMKGGDWFFIGQQPTNVVGEILEGSNKLVNLTLTTGQFISGSPAKVQITERTDVDTIVDVAGALLEIPVGDYRATAVYDIDLADNSEIGAYLTLDSGEIKGGTLVVQTKYLGPAGG